MTILTSKSTQMSGTRKRRVESMHDREDKGEEAAADGGVRGVGKHDSESCDWMQVFFSFYALFLVEKESPVR